MIQPSPSFAMRRSVWSTWPPNQTGMRRCTGNGLIPASSIRCHFPSKVTCGSAHSFCITSTCSAERRPRFEKSSFSPVNSTWFQPMPTPSRNRPPPHSTSRHAACFATSTAWRCGRISTWVENSVVGRHSAAR